ncbi:MAG: ABC transporter permease [Deltaproteobacteria bacterium]|jgi:lipopolysaccharide transport system permease protein|nr:ABC transporter permease [Deltaproteobacteria bacterium]
MFEIFRSKKNRFKANVYLSFRLFRKDLLTQQALTRLGMLWDFMEPLTMAGLFIFLAQAGFISSQGLSFPYALYVIFGFILYQAFTDSVNHSIRVISRNKDILKYKKIPSICLAGSDLFRFLYFGAVRLAILVVALLGFGYFNPLAFLASIAGYFITIVFGMSLGLILSPFNSIYEDIGRLVGIVLSIMRFGTPVMWVFPYEKFLWLYLFNPVAVLIDSTRSMATLGTIEFSVYLAVLVPVIALLSLLSVHVLRKTATLIVEHLS